MKNFHQNLLVLLALALCLLCAYQWYGQTLQRGQMETMNRLLSDKVAAIQNHTNTIYSMDGQITQMDGHISELKGIIKTNENLLLSQKKEMNRLEAENESLTNQIPQYKQAVGTLEEKLKQAYEGVQKQNEAIKQLVAERDQYVQKLNDSVKDRNDIVVKYNALVAQVEQSRAPARPAEK